MTTAVILAAGRGTRMGPLTASRPKPLLTVAGRPLIEHVLCGWAAAGVRRAVIVVGYLADVIEGELGSGAHLGLEIIYRRQERADGTARALLLAEPLIEGEAFGVSWGDILVPQAFCPELVDVFRLRRCAAQLAVNEVDDPWAGAAVYVDEEWRVLRVEEKPARGTSTTRWNNAGLLMLTPAVFDYARRLAPSPRGEYELPQAIAKMIEDGRDVRAYPLHGFWSDLGTPEDLALAEQTFLSSANPA